MSETISPMELQACLVQERPIKVLDVRRKMDYEAEPDLIPGAVWHNPEEVDSWGSELTPDNEVVIYCARGGSVSKSVLTALRAKNLPVRYVEGGLAGWRNSGGEVVRQ